jgi:guanylate kinase
MTAASIKPLYPDLKMITGKLYIISAPSGAGKTSLVKQLITEVDRLVV